MLDPRLHRFAIDRKYGVECQVRSELVTGEVYHGPQNATGGVFTPVVSFVAFLPLVVADGEKLHWHVNCHVRVHQLSPDPAYIGKALADALLSRSICSEPLWVSWYRSEELGGQAYGDPWGDD